MESWSPDRLLPVAGLACALLLVGGWLLWRAAAGSKGKRLNQKSKVIGGGLGSGVGSSKLDATQLNKGLALAMDWGKDWLMPIQERLRAWDSSITPAQADAINEICQRAMRFGWELVRKQNGSALSDAELDEEFRQKMLAKFPWVDRENLSRLYSQALYYAMK
jgi:hypothetical protein